MELKTGDRFGRLTVVQLDHTRKYIDPKGKNRTIEYYLCICDCGRPHISQKNELRNGGCKSCGCWQQECRLNKDIKNKKHGMSDTKIFKRWHHIKERCNNPHNKAYKYYGGRGIKMCDEWNTNFINFYDWSINNGYQDNLTIDRIDVNGDYCPENCRWTTIKEQNTNKTNNIWVEINGKKDLITNWCKIYNINRSAVYKRIKRGWNIQQAITTPVIHPKRLS